MDGEPENFTDTVVAVTRGRHKGRVGYCDSDLEDEAEVYFGSFADGYTTLRSSSLREATATEKRQYQTAFASSPQRFYSRTKDLGH